MSQKCRMPSVTNTAAPRLGAEHARGISLVVHPVPHFLEGIDDFTEILDYFVRHGVPFSYILAMR